MGPLFHCLSQHVLQTRNGRVVVNLKAIDDSCNESIGAQDDQNFDQFLRAQDLERIFDRLRLIRVSLKLLIHNAKDESVPVRPRSLAAAYVVGATSHRVDFLLRHFVDFCDRQVDVVLVLGSQGSGSA